MKSRGYFQPGPGLPHITLALVLLASGHCSFSRKIAYPAYFAGKSVETSLFTCGRTQTMRVWYVLFGSIGINRPDPGTLFRSSASVYRIEEQKTWLDLGLSILMGTISSVTTSTLTYQECTVRGAAPEYRPKPPANEEPAVPPEPVKSPPAVPAPAPGPGPATEAPPAKPPVTKSPVPPVSGKPAKPAVPEKPKPATGIPVKR